MAEREAALKAAADTANALARSTIAGIQQSATPTQRKADDDKNKGRTFLGMSFGQWITAAAIGGCSIIYNRVSPSAYSVYFAVITISAWLCWVTWRFWWVWRSLVWTACVFAFFATYKYILFENSDSKPVTTAKPHLSIALNNVASPDMVLELTNDFFFPNKAIISRDSNSGAFSLDKHLISGGVVLPVKSLEILPRLYFGVKNDSKSEYAGSDSWQLVFDFESSVDFEPTPLWRPILTAGNTNRAFDLEINSSILPNNGAIFDGLQLKPCLALTNPLGTFCHTQIMAKDRRDDVNAYFWLYVVVTTNLSKMHIIQSTNGTAHIPSID